MNNLTKLLIFFFTTSYLIAQTPCENGMAGDYPCNGYDLQSHITLAELNANSSNDSWGWVDPQDGNEYVLMGLDNGTAFIDISNPINPVYLGKLPTHTSSTTWRDVKVYNDYAFIVSEAGGHGMQVFDLTRLRDVASPPETFTEDAHYDGFGSAHNIVINEETGYAYGVGTGSYNGGPHFVNIQDPLNPVGEGGFGGSGYSHDAQVLIYNGPDTDHTGKEIYIGANEDHVAIVDVTDKSNPLLIASATYSNDAYTHQGWFTEDLKYFIVGDELDEQNFGFNTKTIVLDFTDLDNPVHHFDYFGETTAIDHNGYTKGNKYFAAHYKAGMRVLDMSDIDNGNFTEVGYFDTYPPNDSADFEGAWNVYPYFESGNIVISNYLTGGFFLVKSSEIDNENPIAVCQDITAELDENGQVTISAEDVDGGSSDNSGSFSLSVDITNFDCANIGANNITLTVTDPSGNIDTCSAIVTIEDNLAPIIVCPDDQSVEADPDDTYTIPDYVAIGDATAIDNCTENLIISQNPVAGTIIGVGIHIISFEATDEQGNTATCSFEVEISFHCFDVNDNSFSQNLTICPNPSTNNITINSKSEYLETIKIFDINGKLIFNSDQINSGIKTIDISIFPNGIYFIKVNNKVTKKLIKD